LIILGVILLIIGFITGIILWTIGIIALVAGMILVARDGRSCGRRTQALLLAARRDRAWRAMPEGVL
jgi:cytochrome c-type biogenesis protein CcmH/NrfF